jgi:hypothetical protein
MRDDHVLHLVVPETEIDELAEEPRANDLELPSEDTTRVDITVDRSPSAATTHREENNSPSIRFEALIKAQHLTRRSSRHRSDQQRIPQSIPRNIHLQRTPIPQIRRRDAPQIILQLSLLSGTAHPRLVWPILRRDLARSLQGPGVYRLEDLDIEFLRLGGVEGHTEGHEGVGEPLDPDPDGTVTEVGSARFWDGVVVAVDDAVEIECDGFGDGMEFLKVVFTIGDIGGESERGEVADGDLIRGSVFDDLGAEVGRLDGTEVLLVRFTCRMIISITF